jgi:hypothetical protein
LHKRPTIWSEDAHYACEFEDDHPVTRALRSGRAINQKNKAATTPQITTDGIWTNAVFENFVANPHKPFDEYSASSTYIR